MGELNLANLLVRMGTCQLVQMEQLQGNLEEDFVKMEPDPCALMETALYVQMERKLPHVQMEVISQGQDVLMNPNPYVLMELLNLLVLMETNQHVRMETDLHVLMVQAL